MAVPLAFVVGGKGTYEPVYRAAYLIVQLKLKIQPFFPGVFRNLK